MALPSTGSISAADINTELKRASTALFSLGGSDERALAGVLTGTISFADFRGKSAEVTKTLAAGSASITLESLFTAAEWASDTAKRVILPAGITRGSTSPAAAAITVGPSAWGGDLILEVLGTVEGAGGAPNSGTGGAAIDANRLGSAGQKLILNVGPTGVVKGGGGGGGKGGNGGSGTTTTTQRVPTSGDYPWGSGAGQSQWSAAPNAVHSHLYWDGARLAEAIGYNDTQRTIGEWTYYRSTLRQTIPPGSMPNQQYPIYAYAVFRARSTTTTSPGGTGGDGGRGEGHGQSRADGAPGAAGSGAAGAGGAGGRGGLFGAAGSVGSPGVAGSNSGGTNGADGGLSGYSVANPGNTVLSNLGMMVGR